MSEQDEIYVPPLDWSQAYSNANHVPDFSAYPGRWMTAAAAHRAALAAQLRADLPYSTGDRHRFDLMLPERPARGLAIFIHGGYWLRFDKSYWSHFSAGALQRGFAVAIPSYTLCPAARIEEIGREVALAVNAAAGQISGPIMLAGHSAGGQIVTRLMCGGSGIAPDVATRIKSVVSISGLHDLRPLLRTGMNENLRLDLVEARAESPALLEPGISPRMTAWVGAAELPEFLRQTRLLALNWVSFLPVRTVFEPGRNHCNVLDGLVDPNHPLVEAWVGG